MSASICCVKGFTWGGEPEGRIEKIAGRYDTYVAGNNPKAAAVLIHDVFGWALPNVRLLADHYAREANITVYVPDLFLGTGVDRAKLKELGPEKFLHTVILPFLANHTRDLREPDVFAIFRALRREGGFEKVAAVGLCYGGWAALRLAAAPANQPEDPEGPLSTPIVDVAIVAHPSLVTKKDIDEVAVPLLVLAPEDDMMFVPELKQYLFETLPKNGVAFDYVHFPGVTHGCLVRGDETKPGERAAMVRAKNTAVCYLKMNLDV